LPALKEKHRFLRLVHSSPLKNAALRLTASFKEWRKRRDQGYGFPKFRTWSKDFCSLEYDERKGWSAEGRTLRLAFGERAVPDSGLNRAQAKALARKRLTDPDAVHTERIGVTVRLAEPAPKDAYRIEIVREGGELHCVFTRRVAVRDAPARVLTCAYLDPNHKNLAYGLTDGGDAFEIANRPLLKEQNRRIDHIRSRRDRARRCGKLVSYTREDGSVHRHFRPSNAWFRRDRALLREERKRRDQNKTFVHTVLHRVFDDNDAVGLGNYAPEATDHRLGKTRKAQRKSNRSMNNCSLLGAVKRALPQVAAKRGRVAYVMDETGTTRTCHHCGHVVEGGISPDIRSWVCPSCLTVHIRDENSCQNGLGRLFGLLGGDGLLGNPTCDARASADGRHGSPQRGVKVVSRCDWTLVPSGTCRIAKKPPETVAKLLSSAKWAGQGKAGYRRNSGAGDAAPITNLCQPSPPLSGFVCL
jgi:putative transposase